MRVPRTIAAIDHTVSEYGYTLYVSFVDERGRVPLMLNALYRWSHRPMGQIGLQATFAVAGRIGPFCSSEAP